MKNENELVEKIKRKYEEKNEISDIDKLKKLDKNTRKIPMIFAYVYGTISSLIFGTGMCLAMKVIGSSMLAGIYIGLVGMGLYISTYFIYKSMLKHFKNKNRDKIIELSNKILSKDENNDEITNI